MGSGNDSSGVTCGKLGENHREKDGVQRTRQPVAKGAAPHRTVSVRVIKPSDAFSISTRSHEKRFPDLRRRTEGGSVGQKTKKQTSTQHGVPQREGNLPRTKKTNQHPCIRTLGVRKRKITNSVRPARIKATQKKRKRLTQ